MDYFRLLLGVLCVWRLTHLLNVEDGPWRMFSHLRRAAGGGFLGQLVTCFYCLSLWVAVPFTSLLTSRWKDWLLVLPALSAGAILLERLIPNRQFRLEDYYLEDPPDQRVLR
jgi:hypothetical protein